MYFQELGLILILEEKKILGRYISFKKNYSMQKQDIDNYSLRI